MTGPGLPDGSGLSGAPSPGAEEIRQIGQDAGMTLLNPPGAYADDGKFRARQRLWQHQTPYFDVVDWVMGLAALEPGQRVLDAGCGNGSYLRALRERPVRAAGLDLSPGMLRAAGHPHL